MTMQQTTGEEGRYDEPLAPAWDVGRDRKSVV
jgi:hypothetical protein